MRSSRSRKGIVTVWCWITLTFFKIPLAIWLFWHSFRTLNRKSLPCPRMQLNYMFYEQKYSAFSLKLKRIKRLTISRYRGRYHSFLNETHPRGDSGQILAPSVSPNSSRRVRLSAVSTVVKSGNCSATVTSSSCRRLSVKPVAITTHGAHNSGLCSSTASTNPSAMEILLLESTGDSEGVTFPGSISGTK